MGDAGIPVVDLSQAGDPERTSEFAEELCRICHDIGFFVVVNHGVDAAVVADVFDLMERFFSLSDHEKRLIDKGRSPHFRGWEAVGSEFTNDRIDVREQIDVWSEWPPVDDPEAPPASRLLGPNQWMPADVIADQRDITLRWMAELSALADRLLELFAIGLGLDADHFEQMFGEKPMSLTKMIHYPPTPEGGAGVNAHHDTGFVTVLAPGPTAGLQVLDPGGAWIDVHAPSGSFVINLGEMLQAMTGNYFVATPHRVITSDERMSAAYFHGPSIDTELSRIELDPRFADAVRASDRHRDAGFMATADATASGTADMADELRATTYGEQLWNYFRRSYPANVAAHHADLL